MAPGNNHDQNFKNLILDYPRESLAFFAPAEAPATSDRVSITPLRQEQTKERLSSHHRELDVPLLVEWEDGRREVLLFAVEEETVPGRFSPHRLVHYCVDLSALNNTSRVVPVVIFLQPTGKTLPTLRLGSEHRDYLTLEYIAFRLGNLDASDYEHSNNVVARLNLPNMRWPAERKLHVYAAAIRGLFELEPDPNKCAKYLDFIDIYARLTDNERLLYRQQFPEENNIVAGFAERHREEGRLEGILKGKLEGKLEGERALLERQLQRRFGQLDPSVKQRLEQATLDDLETWAESVLDAETLREVFG